MVGRVPLPTPQEFHDRALAHADPQRRLTMPGQSMWEIFPFEPDPLTVPFAATLMLREHLDLAGHADRGGGSA